MEAAFLPEPVRSPWPEGCSGAVSLTFDDGRASQLVHAIPILDEHRLAGSFYLNPRGDAEAERAALGRWVILTFHRIGEGGSELTNTAGALRELCAFLDRSRQRLWTAPLGVVAQRLGAWRDGRRAAAHNGR
jgi:hypothetical protein